MSYCRLSSDNWTSDIYCYASGDIYLTYVATSRVVGEVPEIPADFDQESAAEWLKAANAQTEIVALAERRPIGLPHDGKSFRDATPQACKARLLMLRAVGYHVPEDALIRLDEDMAANEKGGADESQ